MGHLQDIHGDARGPPSVWGGPGREEGAARPGWTLRGPTCHQPEEERLAWKKAPWLWAQTCLDLPTPAGGSPGAAGHGQAFLRNRLCGGSPAWHRDICRKSGTACGSAAISAASCCRCLKPQPRPAPWGRADTGSGAWAINQPWRCHPR